jgi:hypothetical protein
VWQLMRTLPFLLGWEKTLLVVVGDLYFLEESREWHCWKAEDSSSFSKYPQGNYEKRFIDHEGEKCMPLQRLLPLLVGEIDRVS